MLDTGAISPVFCRGVHNFLDFIGDSCKVTDLGETTFYGFTPEPIRASLFKLDDFVFSDNANNSIHYKNFKILVTKSPHLNFELLLPATMFRKMKYSLDYTKESPTFTICAPKDTYYTDFKKEGGPLYTFLVD